jgi:pimeloyl-ACP methyl ester carboxylesterase
VIETDVALPDGRTLHAYDTGGDGPVVFWHHGTPNLGRPPEPLFRDGVRWISYDRPGYGGSTPRPDRDVASVAADSAAVADALGVDRFALLGHSGGGPHALACAALLPDRALAVAGVSGPAPYGSPGLDWFAGMAPGSAASLRAAVEGRAVKEKHEADVDEDADIGFVPADWAALEGSWSWFGSVVGPATAAGPAALIDDDLAAVRPWGFDPATITAPVLLVHGAADRMIPAAHSRWLAAAIPAADLRIVPDEGHVSVLVPAGADTVTWLITVPAGAPPRS